MDTALRPDIWPESPGLGHPAKVVKQPRITAILTAADEPILSFSGTMDST